MIKIKRKISKLQRSNLAHKRLAQKHFEKGTPKGTHLMMYHDSVMRNQIKANRLMSKSEKKKTFERWEKKL